MGKNSKKQFRRNERTYKGHQNLDKFLSDKKLQRKQIAKDGSCLFRAVAEQVFSSQSCHHKVRMQCVEYIQVHRDDFKEFITISIAEYLDQLKNELWGGELELVVLSRLYDRSIIVYNEANGIVHEQVFEDQASTQQHSPIMLAYSGGNHYDSVYSTQHLRNTALCQGIVYEMLFRRVLRDSIPPPCQQRLTTLQESDMEQVRKQKESSSYERVPFLDRPFHLLTTHYKIEEIESMASNIYRNTALDVHQREKANFERHDRHVAASIQFQRGDAVIFKIGDKEMEGEICGLNVSVGCHLVYMHKSREEWEIPAKDIALKQPHLSSGRRSSSGQHRSRSQQQQLSGQSLIHQKGQQPPPPAGSSDPSKATESPTLTREAPSGKKSGSQGSAAGSKSKEGKKSVSAAQQGIPTPSSKGVPANAVPVQGDKIATTTTALPTQPHPPSSMGGTPTSRTPTVHEQKKIVSSNTISPPGTNMEPPTAVGQRRVAPSLSRNIQHTQVRSGHSVKATSHHSGSLDSDDSHYSSEDESSPGGGHHHHRGRTDTTHNLPAYYSEDGWSMGDHEAAHQKQQILIGKNTMPVVEGKIHIGRGGLGYPDTSIKQPQPQQMKATQKSVSGQAMKSGGGGGKVVEVKAVTSKSSDAPKLGSRARGVGSTAPMTKADNTRTSPVGKHSEQSTQQPKVAMQVPAPAGLLQQQSPIQGLIDGPNSERDGRESPPYLERQIPRDPSSQPQDAWPLFEEDPTAMHPHPNIPSTMAAAMLLASRQQHQAPPPPPPTSGPPTPGSGIILPPPSTISTTTTHGINPLPPESTTVAGILPLLPPLPLAGHAAQHQPLPPSSVPTTSPHSPSPDQLQTSTGGAEQLPPPQPLPQNVPPMFHQPIPVSPPSTAAAIPPLFHSLMQPGHFANIPPIPMSTAAAMQQFFGVGGGGDTGMPPPHPNSMEMLYNQGHGHSNMAPPPPPPELASGGGGKPGDSSSMAGMPPLISPLQPLSTKKSSSPHGERAAMSPLLVTAYTQTADPKLTHTRVQTESKQTRDRYCQFRPIVKRVRVQTDGHFVAVTELSPPELENDSKVAKVNFAIDYTIQCLNVYLQYSNDDETSSELLKMMENLKEQRLQEQSMPYESQLTALDASQQDFLVSLARDKSLPQFPINAHPMMGERPRGVSIYQPKPMKEATPPQAGEEVTLQQAAATLPDPSLASSTSLTSDLHPTPPDDDKSSDTNVDVTPQQEAQPPPTVTPGPYPVPHLMMHPQRPPGPGPYMVPMPMFYGPTPGFYPHSFPGVPGMPGMPGMMMPPYAHHMIPPGHQIMPQQRQQQPPSTGQSEQSLESLEETPSTSSTSATKLSPPLPTPPAIISPNEPPPIPAALTTSVELESASSSTSIDHQSVPVVDNIEGPHVHEAIQAENTILEDSQSPPVVTVSPTIEGEEGGIVPPPTDLISTMLEGHLDAQREDKGQQLQGEAAFNPSMATADATVTDAVEHQLTIEQHAGDHQTQDREKIQSTEEPDVNISNPGLPCRGSPANPKEKEVSAVAVEDKENDQRADTKQHKSKSSRTKQQASQDNASSKQQTRASSTTVSRQQQNYSRTGGTGAAAYNNRPGMYRRFNNQRQQQYNNPNRNRGGYYYQHQSNGGKMYPGRFSSGGNGGNGGRFQPKWQGGQQPGSSYSSSSSSSDQGASRPHNPSRSSKAHFSSSEHNSKSVTPVPVTNTNPSTEDHDRNVPQFNNSNNNYPSSGAGKFSPKSFPSFPSSPQNHSSINGEMAINSSSMVVPQSATDSAPMTVKEEKKVPRWHFKESASDRQRLEVPDPNLMNWSSEARQFGYRQQGDYADTIEDPFPTMTIGGDDKEFAFKGTCLDDFDAKHLEEIFPALKSEIPHHYNTTEIHHPPAQCTSNGNDAQVCMHAGLGGGYSAVQNLNNN